MANDVKSIEDKLKKSFSNIKEDINSLRESIENLKESIEKKSEDGEERIERAEKEISDIRVKKDERKDESENNKKLGLISKNISDLAGYLSEMKEEISQLKKQKPAEEKDSEVKNIVEFGELKGEVSELKYLIENIKILPQRDYSEDISELKDNLGGLENNLSKLGKEIKSIRIPEQYDYSQNINQLARELGEIKGSQVSRKHLDKEILKINENISEKLSEIEKKQELLETTIKDRARQPLVISLKEEIKHLKAQIEEDKEKSERLCKEFSKESQKLRNEIEEQNLELKHEIINIESRLTRLYSATSEERKKIVEEERIKEETKENAYKIIKFLIILIPIILIGYIAYSNFLAAEDFNYFYDVGSKQDAKNPYLTPLNRVSDIGNETNTLNYRNITSQLVYFDVPIPRSSDNVTVNIRLKDNFPNKTIASIGAKVAQDWDYTYQTVYNQTLFKNTRGKWIEMSTTFNLKDLYINNGKLSMLFNVPHLAENKNQTNMAYIPIDWINITVHKDGIFEKN